MCVILVGCMVVVCGYIREYGSMGCTHDCVNGYMIEWMDVLLSGWMYD